MVERNLAKVEVESSRLFSRSIFQRKGSPGFPFLSARCLGAVSDAGNGCWRDSKAVMHRIANPISPVRLRVAPPIRSIASAVPGDSWLLRFARVVKLVDTADLKSAAILHKGRTGSSPVLGTKSRHPVVSVHESPLVLHQLRKLPLALWKRVHVMHNKTACSEAAERDLRCGSMHSIQETLGHFGACPSPELTSTLHS